MNLYYFKDKNGNFGDDLNEWLWPKIFKTGYDNYFDDETLFIGIGSILDENVPDFKRKVILGSGYAYSSPPKVDSYWSFYSVRGPLTAQILGLNNDIAITDSAIISTPFLDQFQSNRTSVSFMPHHRHTHLPWSKLCEELDILYIDPCDGVESCLSKIGKSKVIITEAMHGAIIADCMRIPWIPIKSSQAINDFKWKDWTLSMEVDFHFTSVSQPITNRYTYGAIGLAREIKNLLTCRLRLAYLKKYGTPYLSKESVFNNRLILSNDALNSLISSGKSYEKKN